MAQRILLDNTNLLDVIIENDHYQLHYGFHRLANFRKNDAAAKRITVVQVANMGVKKSVTSRAFDVNPSSIYFWLEIYD